MKTGVRGPGSLSVSWVVCHRRSVEALHFAAAKGCRLRGHPGLRATFRPTPRRPWARTSGTIGNVGIILRYHVLKPPVGLKSIAVQAQQLTHSGAAAHSTG